MEGMWVVPLFSKDTTCSAVCQVYNSIHLDSINGNQECTLVEDYSNQRFSQECNLEEFIVSFFSPSTPGLQSEFYLNGELIGLGFLDKGEDCLSSVYFIYDTRFSHLGLGTFSILKEIEHTRSLGLKYYCLGYYVRECQRMAYKNNFKPREHYNWLKDKWDAA